MSNGTVGCDPQFGMHRLVKSFKGTSSRLLRQELPVLKRNLPSLGTNSYCVATTGGVTLESLKGMWRDKRTDETSLPLPRFSDQTPGSHPAHPTFFMLPVIECRLGRTSRSLSDGWQKHH